MQNRGVPSKAPAVLAVLGGIVTLWTGGTVALLASTEPPPMPARVERVASRETPQAPLSLTPFPRSLEELRAMHAAIERPPPDARLVAAFAEVRRLAGQPRPTAAARPEGDRWVVTLDGREVARLPDLATPADALPLLVLLLGERPPSGPDATAPAHVADLAPGAELAALRALDAAPGPGGPPHPAAAARVLAAMLHNTYDTVEGSELLAARALAAAAWARAVGTPAPDAEALMTRSMGYHAVAKTLAASLPVDDPLRAYVDCDGARLAGVATRPGAAYLRFRQLIDQGNPAVRAAFDAMDAPTRASLAVVGWRRWVIRGSDFAAHLDARRQMPGETLAALEAELGGAARGSSMSSPFVRAGSLLSRPQPAGAWLDGALVAARVYAATRSAVQISLDAELEMRGDPDAAQGLVDALRPGAPAAFTATLAWFDAEVANGRGDARALASMATGTDELSGALRLTAAEESRAWAMPDALPRLAVHLDGRVAHSYRLLGRVESEGLDPVWHRRLCRAASVEPELPPDDVAGCRLRDNTAPPAPDTPAEAEARFRERNAHAQRWMESRAEYGRWLIAQHRAAETVTLAREWLAAHPEGLEPAFARTGMARAQLALGDPAAAWATIEPALASYQSGALYMGVTVLLAQGRLDEALALARRALERYGDTEQAARVAEVLWRQDKADEAARVLRPYAARRGNTQWRSEVGEALARVFLSQPTPALGAAAVAMTRQRLPIEAVEALAEELARDGHAAHALALHEALSAPGLRGLALFAARHRLMTAVRSREEADRWLETAVPAAARGPVAQFAFGDGDDALVWFAADTAQDDPEHTAYLWLLRAGSLLRSAPDAARRARVEAAVAAPTDPYHHLARYLLGQETLEQALALATTEDRRAEVAFWVGLRAHCEGRLEEAADWYRFVARRGPMSEGEVRWAVAPLRRWSREPFWLDRIADPWAQAHAGTPPAPATETPAAETPSAPAAETPATDDGDRHHRHRAPDGHHRHRRHHSRGASTGGRS